MCPLKPTVQLSWWSSGSPGDVIAFWSLILPINTGESFNCLHVSLPSDSHFWQICRKARRKFPSAHFVMLYFNISSLSSLLPLQGWLSASSFVHVPHPQRPLRELLVPHWRHCKELGQKTGSGLKLGRVISVGTVSFWALSFFQSLTAVTWPWSGYELLTRLFYRSQLKRIELWGWLGLLFFSLQPYCKMLPLHYAFCILMTCEHIFYNTPAQAYLHTNNKQEHIHLNVFIA